MWAFIFLGMGILTLAVLVYLVSRFCKFAFVRRLAGGRKPLRILIAALFTAGIAAGCWIFIDMINMAIILVHLGAIWLICDGIGCLPGLRERSRNSGLCALLISAVYLSCGWYLAHHVWEKDYRITTEKEVGNLRIVQFADSHVGTTFHAEGFAEQVARMQETNPDVVVVTGDYVDDDTTREDMIAACEALGSLKTTYGVYFAFGNHDKGYYGDMYRGYSGADLVAELEKNGVHVLQDEVVSLDDRFYLIGRKDRSEEQMGASRLTMEELTRGLDPERFSIVLDHQPHDYAAQEETKVDLVLSGHTHGGQLFPINYLGEWTGENEKTYGLEKRGSTNFIVTSGISDWAIKFKTGCKSEFVVIDIEENHESF